MELFTKIINGSKPLTFPAKSSILDILLGPENASGFTVFNYFHQKLHLRSLRGLICLCIYLVWQFWRWIKEISKVCYEEIQKNGNKYVASENSCSKNFVQIQEKPPHEIAFLNKILGKLLNSQNSFHKKHAWMVASAINCHWKMFSPKYIFQKISHSIFFVYVLIFSGMCSQGLSV